MAGPATIRLYQLQKFGLALDTGRDAVARGPGARELAFAGNVEERIPVACGVVFRSRLRGGRINALKVDDLARLRLRLRGIHQPIAAHPDAIRGIREVRN